jgi:hypothetical protein
VDLITRDDFQPFWRSAREKTESFYSGCHFGHYVAAARDNTVNDLHVISLNTVRELGIMHPAGGGNPSLS